MAVLVLLHDDSLAEVKCHIHGWHNIPAKQWHYDGNAECPSFSPSVNELKGQPGPDQQTRCHFSISKGQITYHDNDKKQLEGQTVPMLAFTDDEVKCSEWVQRQDETKIE